MRGWMWGGLVAAVALGVRLAYVMPQTHRLDRDPDSYGCVAAHLAAGRGFTLDGRNPTAYRPCLYPLLLAGLDRAGLGGSTPLAVVQILLGTATVVLVFIAVNAVGSRAGAVVAGVLAAVDPLLVHNTALRMTETLAALLLAAGVWTLAQLPRRHTFPRGLLMGLVLGLAVLCRPSLGLLLLAILVVAAVCRSAAPALTGPVILGVVVGAAACELPWVARNWLRLGYPVLTTTHGGHTLHRGNNPFFFRDAVRHPYDMRWPTQSFSRWQADTDTQAVGLTEIQRDRFEYALAWRFMRSRPDAMLACSWRKFRRFWAVQPNPVQVGAIARSAIGIFYAIQIPLWLVGACVGRGVRWFRTVLVVTVLALGLTHALYWSNMRMRTPVMPALAVLAGLGVGAMLGKDRVSPGQGRTGSACPCASRCV